MPQQVLSASHPLELLVRGRTHGQQAALDLIVDGFDGVELLHAEQGDACVDAVGPVVARWPR